MDQIENDAPTILNCHRNIYIEFILAKIGGCTDRPTDTCIHLLLYIFVAVGMCLSSHCPAVKGGIHLTDPLPSNSKRDAHTGTD
jgi:hypothetical protein